MLSLSSEASHLGETNARGAEVVDDDSQGARATFKDDLMLLAGLGDDHDGTWVRELAKLLREEQQERTSYRNSALRGCGGR
jgi:hypothetical protein